MLLIIWPVSVSENEKKSISEQSQVLGYAWLVSVCVHIAEIRFTHQ